MMLACYIGIISQTTCAFRKWIGRDTRLSYIVFNDSYGLAGLVAGPAIYVDKVGRLTELNGYVFTKFLQTIFIYAQRKGYAKSIPYGDMFYFVPTMAILATCLQHYPHSVHGIAEPILKWIFPKQ